MKSHRSWELFARKLGQSGVMATRMGPGHWMDELGHLGITLPGGINPKAPHAGFAGD